jgi:hypothetical protein
VLHPGFGVEHEAAHGGFEFGGVAPVAFFSEDGADFLFEKFGGRGLGKKGGGR